MIKRRRPKQHSRIIKTSKGLKKILVNKGVKYSKKKRLKRGPTVTKRERKVFNHLSNPKHFSTEYGGVIDFDKKGRIESFAVIPGRKWDVDIPDDYEVKFHTHPSNYIDPPSPEDIIALLSDKKQQAEVVFRDGTIFIVNRTPKTFRLEKLGEKAYTKILTKAFNETRGKDWDNRYKDRLEQLGFQVIIDKNKNKAINIPVRAKD